MNAIDLVGYAVVAYAAIVLAAVVAKAIKSGKLELSWPPRNRP